MAICINATSYDTIPLGFFSPNTDDDHPPQICMPSTDCYLQRIQGLSFCEAQGALEPTVCKPGHYCPPGGKQQIRCPEGSICPVGSYAPHACWYSSFCPPGASVQIYPMLAYVALAIDVLLILRLGVTLYRQKQSKKARAGKRDEEQGDQDSPSRSQESCPHADAVPHMDDFPHMDPFPHCDDCGGHHMNAATPADATPHCDDCGGHHMGAATHADAAPHMDGAGDFAPLPRLRLRAITTIDTIRRRRPIQRRPVPPPPPNADEEAVLGFIRRARVESGLDFTFATANIGRGRIPKGKIVGVIGPEKSQFLNALSRRTQPAKDTEGSGVVVSVNGHAIDPHTYENLISVIPRDDIAIPHLTVRENILHAARMRLPSTFSRADIHSYVDTLIRTLNLTEVQHSYAGSSENPTISAALRKLVDIAMGLAAGPTAIFLDEPSAHMSLDDAAILFRLLKFISQAGVTVVVTMNQPTRDIWDNIHLAGSGQHTPGAYPNTPCVKLTQRELTQLKAAADDRAFPWFHQL